MKSLFCATLSAIVTLCQCTEHRTFLNPVILVPGDGGSRLEAKLNKPRTVHDICQAKSDWFTLWLDPRQLLPFFIDCWADNMALKYDFKSKTTFNNDGVETRIPGFGNTTSVEFLSIGANPMKFAYYFHSIIEALVGLGYERGINIHGAPYDFRKAPNEHMEYFNRLVELIESSYASNGNKSVILISHSMGSTMVLYMLNSKSKSWKDKYIKCHISLSGVWAGTVKAMKVFAVGDNLGNPMVLSSSLMVAQRTNPSLNWLMPNLNFWTDHEVFVRSDNINITRANFPEFYQALKSRAGLDLWKNSRLLVKDMRAPEVEMFCIFSRGIPTVEQLVYHHFPEGEPVQKFGDGDGTVNLRSLNACKSWRSKQSQAVNIKIFSGVDHMRILSDYNVTSYIKFVIEDILQTNDHCDRENCEKP